MSLFRLAAAPVHSAATSERIAGLDLCRCVALGLVILQHGMSLSGHHEATEYAGINPGQVGVAIFIAIAGIFSAIDQRPPAEWLWRRLVRIFPTYWIVMAVSFWLTWYTAYKPFDTWQVISQMLGLGAFTHYNALINVASWFISLLLLCYGLAFLCRLSGYPAVTAFAGLAVLIRLQFRYYDFHLLGHTTTFMTSFALCGWGNLRLSLRLLFPLCSLLLGAGGLVLTDLRYTAIALISLSGGALLPLRLVTVRRVAEWSYEFYLVHGIFLVGAARYLPFNIYINITLGIAAGFGAAAALQQGVTLLARLSPARSTMTSRDMPREIEPAFQLVATADYNSVRQRTTSVQLTESHQIAGDESHGG